MKLRLIAIGLMMFSMVYIFGFTPTEQSQGLVQKIFYIHVSSAITMYFGFFIGFIGSLMYVIERKNIWDHVAHAGVEVGFIFCGIVLSTGPLWAKPIWGTYWTWEPRLTTTFLLFLMYCAYLIIRQYLKHQRHEKMIAAVIAMIAFLDVPLIHYSVKLWRGIHPSVISEKDGLPNSMQQTLIITMFSCLVLFAMLWREKFINLKLKAKIKQKKLEQS